MSEPTWKPDPTLRDAWYLLIGDYLATVYLDDDAEWCWAITVDTGAETNGLSTDDFGVAVDRQDAQAAAFDALRERVAVYAPLLAGGRGGAG